MKNKILLTLACAAALIIGACSQASTNTAANMTGNNANTNKSMVNNFNAPANHSSNAAH